MRQANPIQIPKKLKLSVIIPCFNEEANILPLLTKVLSQNFDREFEVVIVNDGSSDLSEKLILGYIQKNKHLPLFYFKQENQGKGGAVSTGVKNSSGDIILIQDADLEYDPSEYPALLEKIDQGEFVVYGSRNKKTIFRRHSGWSFLLGGLLVTKLTNLLFGSDLTDEATGYKVFRREVFTMFDLKQKDFGWEPEITAKILKNKIKISEIAISYNPRSKAEGKKISWRDGVKACWILFYEYFNP